MSMGNGQMLESSVRTFWDNLLGKCQQYRAHLKEDDKFEDNVFEDFYTLQVTLLDYVKV